MIDSILIVEDDTNLRELLVLASESLFPGASIVAVGNSEKAKEAARKLGRPFALNFLDGNFPETERGPEVYGACFQLCDELAEMYGGTAPNIMIHTGTDAIKEEAERRGIPALIKGNGGMEQIEELARRYASV